MMNTDRLSQFMARIATETYPEPLCDMHSTLTAQAMEMVFNRIPKHYVEDGIAILDVGCGQGPALKAFRDRGLKAMGIALNYDDVDACRKDGFIVLQMDQN